MKKILLSLILILSLVLLCSCNSDKDATNTQETKSEINESISTETVAQETESEINESISTETVAQETESEDEVTSNEESDIITTQSTSTEFKTEGTEESTNDNEIVQGNIPSGMSKIVYSNVILEIEVESGIKVESIPKGFSFVYYLDDMIVEEEIPDKVFTFEGKSYELSAFEKVVTFGVSGEVRDNIVIYEGDNCSFSIQEGTDRLTEMYIKEKKDYSSNNGEITETILNAKTDAFMSTYAVLRPLEGYRKDYISNGTMHRVEYNLYIGKYRVENEGYIFNFNADGELYYYADSTTGLYDKFIGKVTEEDIMDAESRLYAFNVAGAYGHYTPHLKVGNDGNLYLCSAYFVDEEIDGETIAREYMFYSRVYYEE